MAGHRASPFTLFGRDDMRAGLRFDVLREAAKKESVKQYECVDLWAKAQRCSVPIEIGNALGGRRQHGTTSFACSRSPIRFSAMASNVHGQLIFRDVVRDTRVAWDSVGICAGSTTAIRRRRSSAGSIGRARWGASLWYSRARRADVPRLIRRGDRHRAGNDAPGEPRRHGPAGVCALRRSCGRPPTATPVRSPASRRHRKPPTADEILTMLRSDFRALTIAGGKRRARHGPLRDRSREARTSRRVRMYSSSWCRRRRMDGVLSQRIPDCPR